MMSSGPCSKPLITDCSALMICWPIHWAAFVNQQMTSNGLHEAAGRVAPVLWLEDVPAPSPTDRGVPDALTWAVWMDVGVGAACCAVTVWLLPAPGPVASRCMP